MKKKFTFLMAACVMLLTMAVHPLTILGQAKTDYEWVETDFDDLTASDIFVIAGTSNAKVYSLGNNASGKPTATEITINGTKITSNVTTAMQWKRVTVTGGYKFQSQAVTSNYLRWSSGTTMGTNSTNSNNVFTWITFNNDGVYYLYNTAGSRYVCKYKAGSDWRAYSGANDISTNATVTKFYKRQEVSSDPVVTITNPTGGTISVANGGTPVSSGANIASATTLTLDKTITAGYTFDRWKVFKTGDESTAVTVTNNQFTMPAYDVTVTAVVNANPSHTVTLNSVTGGTIEADPSGSVREGVTVTITATPDNNHVFGSWSVTGATSASTTNAQTTFTMSTSDVTVGALFTQAYHVIYDANTTGETGSTTDNNKYVEGASATVQPCGFSKAGYEFVKWNTQKDGNGTDYYPSGSGTPSSITIETADVTLYAIWDIASYTVAVASLIADATITAVHSGGSIAEGSNANIKCGSTVTLLADGLASGKGVAWDVYKTGESSTKVTVTDNSFEVPAYNVTISATVGDLFERYYTDNITAGDYVIYSDGAAMKNSISSSRFVNETSNISVSGNELLITSSTTAADVTWQAAKFGNTDYWTLYNADENKYAGSTSTRNTGALISPDDVDNYAKWTVEQPTNGEFNFVNLGRSGATDTPANKYLRKNGNNGWACYATGTGTKPSLYKKVASYQLDVLSVGHGDITANISGHSAIAEGTNANVRPGVTVTLVALPDTDYANDGWTVYKTGDESTTVTVTDNQFIMPSYPVTVTTEFKKAATVTLKYMVNGVAIDVNVKEGSSVTLITAGEITVPSGSTFNGWSTSATDFTTILTGSYTVPVGGATLYAVFSQTAPATFHFEITDADFVTSGYSDNNNEKTTTAIAITGETMDVNWTSYQVMKSGGMQWKKSEGYIYNSTDLGTIISVVITSSEGSFTTCYGTTAQPSSGTTPGEGKGYFKTSVGDATGKTSSIVVTFVKNVPRKFSKVYGNESATGDIAINAPTLIPSGKVLNMGNHTLTVTSNYLTVADASCLVIGDGGQLICNNSVAATVQKSIEASDAPTSKGAGWYTISSPVNNAAIASVTNLVVTDPYEYDLYRFNETKDDSDEDHMRWENYKKHGYTNFENGRGYIYRKNNSTAIEFVGNTNVGSVTYALTYSDVPVLAGFNLIGNPYPHSIAKGNSSSYAIQNGDYLATNYYILSNDDTWALCTDGSEIPSKQGILVQTVTGFDLTITDTPFTPAEPGKYRNDNIRFSVKNEKFEDVAYAWFDKGHGLPKIAHRNPDAPMLYIPQNGTNYATAIMSDDIKVFGLSFKAMTMSRYTLRAKANGDYTYLHVIDRLTGEDVDMLLEGEYSFIASPNDNENRFIVKLEYKPDYSESNSDIFAYQSGSEIFVSGEGELQVFDVTGRNVMTTNINGAEAINGLSNGVYVFRLVGNDIKTQKIVVR